MIDDLVKQTRCTTCDAEHEYKQGRVPTLRRKKDTVSAAYQEVLSAVTGDAGPTAAPGPPPPPAASDTPAVEEQPAAEVSPAASLAPPPREPETEPAEPIEEAESPENGAADAGEDEGGRVHRRLIRATLPRPENQQSARPLPQFTMRQPMGRPGKFRGGAGRGPGGRPPGLGRMTGNVGGSSRPPAFGRPGGGRGGDAGRLSGRNDMQRPARGGHPHRHGKKHSK